jgi:hypothetical protein
MKLPALATRLLISAAISSVSFPITACAGNPPPSGADANPQPQAATQASASSPQDAAPDLKEQNARMKDKQKAVRDMQMAIDKNRRALDDAAKNMDSIRLYSLGLDDKPTLLITQPIDPHAPEEWTEDLKIMDRLFRNAINRSGGEEVPVAMGIKLTLFGRVPPTYIEDCGVLFTFGVNFPLASAANATGKPAQPPEPESAWDRAKREIDNRGPARPDPSAPLSFDQAKVDSLLNSIVSILPQAANFRHLNDGEFLFVTIASTDTARAPIRLTLKAKKSDINDAFHGTITPDEFKKRVAWHIG